ncbi:nuclear transport factor 2 family protein [Streptomyces misionensis]|uniref:nuclear transport factor 2 family protein n=1 Tax=Streptomyces misionensis TaxID=67331 RepID=UPI00396BC057
MDPVQRLLAERACERLIVDFVHRLDLGEPASVAELFTEDGSWEWPPPGDGRRVRGRAALGEYFGARPADRLSRRLMSGILVTVVSAETATAISYFSTHRVDGCTGGGLVPAGPPVQVGHYEDTFRRTGDRWLPASRVLRLAFGGPTPSVR